MSEQDEKDYWAFRVLDFYRAVGTWTFRILVAAAAVALVVFLGYWLLQEWYISTHCTMVLGTRVCQ